MNSSAGSKPVNGKRIDPVGMVEQVCAIAGSKYFIQNIRREMKKNGLNKAVADHDNEAIFNCLMGCFSFQGVSDAVASGYIEEHGNANYSDIENKLQNQKVLCSKLSNFEAFVGCGYKKSSWTCGNSKLIRRCPLPSHPLRKGQLNQAAYSLYLFIRDVCKDDLVKFIDAQLKGADRPGHPDRIQIMREALENRLLAITGISSKLINMSFADFLIGTGRKKTRWTEVGTSMIAIDGLVHNFLRRTGIHYCYGTDHQFGPSCYGENGCAEILDDLAREINSSKFGKAYPIYFPRYIQHAIWWFCAGDGLDVCNGNNIDGSRRCEMKECQVNGICGRVSLNY